MLREIDSDFQNAAGSNVSFKETSEDADDAPLPEGTSELIHQLFDAVVNRENGPWRDLPDDIWRATMGCYPRFINEYRRSYGTVGFDRFFWTTRQRDAKLFRIGTLEYEILTKEDGEKIVSVHIPTDVDMSADALNTSVKAAQAFFRTYFPEWADVPYECDSWLLSPLLRGLLPESSHIIMFQNAFDITDTDPDDSSALEWVFYIAGGQRSTFKPEELPENTSLQKKLKALYLKGVNAGAARGILARSFE